MIKPIETEYRGCRFRSRLEARWAVYFDAIGADWEYEPEGFDLGDGLYYLPDFVLHNLNISSFKGKPGTQDVFVEVKGVMTEKDAEKIKKFANPDEGRPLYIVSNMPNGMCFGDPYETHCDLYYYSYELLCSECYDAWLFLGKDGKPGFFRADYGDEFADLEATRKAFDRAKSARFEHGENPYNPKSILTEMDEEDRQEWMEFLRDSGVKCEPYLYNSIKYKGIKNVLYYSNVPEDVDEGIMVVSRNKEGREDFAKILSDSKNVAITVGPLPTEDEYIDMVWKESSDWKVFYDKVEEATVDISEYRYNDEWYRAGNLCWIETFLDCGKALLKPTYLPTK